MYSLDRELFQILNSWRGPVGDPFWTWITDTGLGEVQFGALLAVAAIRGWAGAKGRRVGAALLAVVLVVGATKGNLAFHTASLALMLALAAPLTAREAGYCIGAAATSGLVRLFIMDWADRQRPSNFAWARPLEDVYGHTSFPSGHATTTFAIAWMVLFLTWRTPRWPMGAAALGWAVLVAVSRSVAGVHYPSDTLAGAALGLVFAAGWELARGRRRD